MYFAHFGLKEPPFKITPNTEVFFKGGNRGAVLDALLYAITSGEGIVKVVGEVGSGKTMLCRMLQTMLPENVESIYLANPSVAPEDVLHAIAFELQLKLPKAADRLKVMQALQTHLLKRHEAGKQVVIFVEEAQGMPLATLEEIRLLSNLETKHDKLLQIVLFGQPELDENLNQTNIRQLRERITHSFHLAPLPINVIGEYLIFRLRSAGYFGPPLFTQNAVKKLSNASEGLVRRVNILADKALLAAYAEGGYQVTAKHVLAAISDSEFGMEQAKVAAKKKKWLMWGGMLALGLVAGFLVSMWLHDYKAVKQTPKTVSNVQPIKTPIVSVPQQEKVVKAEASPINSMVENALTLRLNATRAWLSNQPPSTVSIQLLGGTDDAQVNKQLEQLSQLVELDNLYAYRTQVLHSGGVIQPSISVLYGAYADRAEAMQALKKLPIDIQKNKPQLRTVAGVLQEIK